MSDVNGDVITDINGDPAEWSYTNHSSAIYNASSSNPQLFLGGTGGYAGTPYGIYDDVVVMTNQGIAYSDMDLSGPQEITPVVNSFSTSASSATSGSSVTLHGS